MKDCSLIDLIQPHSNSTIMIYDVHASESGALSILNDFYRKVLNYPDKSVCWVFVVSTPEFSKKENIKVLRYPWVKKNWGYRLLFENLTMRDILYKYKPDKIFSLQNKGISFYHKSQYVYLHLPFILTDHKFNIKNDGKKLWIYQNILSKVIFNSLRKVDMTIVQTQWMKQALINKAGILQEKIVVRAPEISSENIGSFVDTKENRKHFFYPATSFTYKNHMTMLMALNYAVERGLKGYELFLTIRPNENKYTEKLADYCKIRCLNVIFHGPISRDEVFRRYTNSVLLFPSYVESFGLPLLEAKMTGTPVIAADCSFSREILEGYSRGSFFPEMDYKKMGKLILKLEKKEWEREK